MSWCPKADVLTENLHVLTTYDDGSIGDVDTLCAASHPHHTLKGQTRHSQEAQIGCQWSLIVFCKLLLPTVQWK